MSLPTHHGALFNRNAMVSFLPARTVLPVERENDLASRGECICG